MFVLSSCDLCSSISVCIRIHLVHNTRVREIKEKTAWCPVWTGGRNQVLSWNTRVCPQTGNTAGNFLTEVQLMDNTLPVSQNEAGAKHRKVFLSRWAQRRNTSVHRHQKLREVKHEVGVLVSIQKSCCETLSTHDRLWWHKHIMIQTERQTWSSWSSCMRTSWHERCVWECLPVTVTITQLLLTVIKLTWGQLLGRLCAPYIWTMWPHISAVDDCSHRRVEL